MLYGPRGPQIDLLDRLHGTSWLSERVERHPMIFVAAVITVTLEVIEGHIRYLSLSVGFIDNSYPATEIQYDQTIATNCAVSTRPSFNII
jgi:hypothetical protein